MPTCLPYFFHCETNGGAERMSSRSSRALTCRNCTNPKQLISWERIRSAPRSRHRWSTRRIHATLEQSLPCAKIPLHRNSARILNSVICVSVLHVHFQIALHSGPFEISCRASTKSLLMETPMPPVSKFEHAFLCVEHSRNALVKGLAWVDAW